jgi:hypothetical protein
VPESRTTTPCPLRRVEFSPALAGEIAADFQHPLALEHAEGSEMMSRESEKAQPSLPARNALRYSTVWKRAIAERGGGIS